MNVNPYVQNSKIFDNMSIALDSTDAKVETKDDTSKSFLDTLKEKLNDVNDSQLNAEAVSDSFVKGEGPDIHEVSLAVSEASLSLDMAIQVRNKLVEAYQELNKMQL